MDNVKCYKCGNIVWRRSQAPLVTAHGETLEMSDPNSNCVSEQWRRGQIYAMGEEMPDWVLSAIEAANWQSGKLSCPCGITLGSFDFTSGRKCECGDGLLPPVHLNTKKIDIIVRPRTPTTS